MGRALSAVAVWGNPEVLVAVDIVVRGFDA
jgi:hypothetical protein